jgi:hypothetical protein
MLWRSVKYGHVLGSRWLRFGSDTSRALWSSCAMTQAPVNRPGAPIAEGCRECVGAKLLHLPARGADRDRLGPGGLLACPETDRRGRSTICVGSRVKAMLRHDRTKGVI